MTDVFGASSGGNTPMERVFGFAKKHAKLVARAAAAKTAATVVETAELGVELVGQGISNAREAIDGLSSDQTMPQQESPAMTHARLLAEFQAGQQHTTKMPGVRRVNK